MSKLHLTLHTFSITGSVASLSLTLNEIHGNRIPKTLRDIKLFKKSVELIILRFGLHVSNTELAELLYIYIEA